MYFVLVGMSVGTAGGLILGAYLFRPTIANPIMKSIACLSFKGTDVSSIWTILKQLQPDFSPLSERYFMQNKFTPTDFHIRHFN